MDAMDSVLDRDLGLVVFYGYPHDVERWLYRKLMQSSGRAYDLFIVSAFFDSRLMSVRDYLDEIRELPWWKWAS